MSTATSTGDVGAGRSSRSTDPEAHGGPSLSSMTGGGVGTPSSGAMPDEAPAGPGEAGKEWREPVDSVGAAPGRASRALRTVRDHTGVTAGILACVVAVAAIAILILRRR